MGVLIPPGYAVVRLNWRVAGKQDPIIVTFGCVAGGNDDPGDIAEAVNAYWAGDGQPYEGTQIAQGWTWAGVEVTQMTASGPVLGSAATSVPGTQAIETPTPAVAMLVRKYTTRGGRKGRGRAFFPLCLTAESNIDRAGFIDASHRANLQDSFDSVLAVWRASSYPPVLLHEDGSAPNPITSLSVESQVATQRRRQR